jgi:DNA polymerase
MFIGEAPGGREDATGRPFVGPAGQLLDRIIRAIDLDRQEVFIANIVKCRPPENRDPLPEECSACEEFLWRQIALVQPQIIVALGRIAARWLLDTSAPLSRLRGRFHNWGRARLMATYHPSLLLRKPVYKRPVWEDMKKVRELYFAED